MIGDRLGAQPLVTQLPIGVESSFAGVVDLVQMKAIVWKDETLGAEFVEDDVPADLADQVAEYRTKLVELAVEQDDAAMEIGRAHVRTPVTNAHIVCRLLLVQKKNNSDRPMN